MAWNVLATAATIDGIGAESADFLRKNGCNLAISRPFRALAAAELRPLLKGVQAVYAGPDAFSANLLASDEACELRIISRWGVGFDGIDLEAATAQGIVVTTTPGMLDEAVADFTFALMLSLARRIHTAHGLIGAGEWSPQWGPDVHGKTLGLIGCGGIGTAVARRATGFQMRVLATDPHPGDAARALGVEFVPLDALLAQSDFVSLHAAVTPDTKGLMGEPQLRLMKPEAYLINTGRGALVDEPALASALNDGVLAGAAVDAFTAEPLPTDHPLRAAKNLLITPHQAAFANETGLAVSAVCAQAIVDLMEGRRPRHVLNPMVLDAPSLRATLR